MLIVRGAAKGLADERRIEAPIDLAERSAADVTRGATLLPPGIWAVIVLALVVAGLLRYTRFGRHVFAIGSNERMARLCGVAITRTKIVVYTLSAALAGIAGLLQFSKLSVGDPTVAVGLELDVIAAVIIGGGSLLGGRGTVAGTLIGAAIMTIIQIGCSQKGLANWVQQIVTGGIIVAAVALDRVRSTHGDWSFDEDYRDLEIVDLRFPTSLTADGTDAVHPDPDYSAAYVILKTDGDLEGHGFTFTIGRGNEVCVEAIRAFAPLVVGRDARRDHRRSRRRSGGRWRRRLAAALARAREGRHPPLDGGHRQRGVGSAREAARASRVWKLLADMTPRRDRRRASTSGTSPTRSRQTRRSSILERQQASKGGARGDPPARRLSRLHDVGRLDGLFRRQGPAALPRGDRRRLDALQGQGRRAIRPTTRGASGWSARRSGPASKLMIDANQRWDVNEAIERVRALSRFNLLWIEEPTSPDDVLGTRRSRARVRADRRRHRRALREPRASSSSSCRRKAIELLPDRQLPPRRREREPRGHPDGREVRRARSARTPAASGCASWCSTCRCSTTCASPAAWTIASPSSSITCTSTSSIPSSSAAAATWRPRAGLQQRDQAGVESRVRVSRRACVEGTEVTEFTTKKRSERRRTKKIATNSRAKMRESHVRRGSSQPQGRPKRRDTNSHITCCVLRLSSPDARSARRRTEQSP